MLVPRSRISDFRFVYLILLQNPLLHFSFWNIFQATRFTDSNGTSNDREQNNNTAVLPPEEMQDMMDQFTSMMQQKFMSGEDHQHLDYTKIDNDETLDDHWLREIGLDAEEKYFGED